ncbi:ABC transporter permease, partial [Rhizobium ruizarguesonis]
MNALAARFNAIFGADMAGPLAALAVVLIVFGFASPHFLTGATFGSVAFQ